MKVPVLHFLRFFLSAVDWMSYFLCLSANPVNKYICLFIPSTPCNTLLLFSSSESKLIATLNNYH